jgi:predicted TIM-barrel fold metal-dependent hydrolase
VNNFANGPRAAFAAATETGSAARRHLPGAIDCHLHIFGPQDRYPYTAQRAYTPPEASLASNDALSSSLGLDRMVIVQPSV